MRLWGNEYNKMEFAGAFGDLGTLIPFVMGYVTLNQMDPVGILVAFGIFKIFVGLYFRTPIPIQPMKAIEGLGMMRSQPITALGGIALTLLLLNSRRLPAMLALLGYGVIVVFIQRPELVKELSHLSIRFRLPELTLGQISWKELLSGFVILGLPQAPLTLGNAIIATVTENNNHFPEKKVTAKKISIDHGIMNLISAFIGGVPLCHGAGGMAGHLRFGARTGGALVILGMIVLLIGLFLSDSVVLLFQVFPRPILGVILFFAGVELALVIKDIKLQKQNLFVLLVTAGTAMWNMGVAYLAGLILYYSFQRRWFKI